jgi:hypothetical protein
MGMIDLPRWWRRLRPTLSAYKETEPVGDLERQLAAALPYDLPARFAPPAMMAAYFERLGACDWLAGSWSLSSASSALHNLHYNVRIYPEISQFDDAAAGIRAAGVWIPLAHNDKHELLLCCDRTRDDFGRVVDAFDTHPWFNDTGIDIRPRGTLEQWMDSLALAALPSHALIELTSAELAQLDSLRDDPPRLFAAALALEDEDYPKVDTYNGSSWLAHAATLHDEDNRRLSLIDPVTARQLIESYLAPMRQDDFLQRAADAGNTVLAHCRGVSPS